MARCPSARSLRWRGVDHLARDPLAPRHAQEESAVVVLANRDVSFCFTPPLQIEHERAVPLSHRPALRLGQHRVAAGVEQVIDGLPADFLASFRSNNVNHVR
jgi:hypothetical protein